MRSKKRTIAFLLAGILALLALMIAGYAVVGALTQPNRVQINFTNEAGTKVYSSHTVQDAAATQKLYTAIQQLPQQKGFPLSCPADWGVNYRLTFFRQNTALPTITFGSGGCPLVILTKDDIRTANDAFEALFASTLGVPTQDLFQPPAR